MITISMEPRDTIANLELMMEIFLLFLEEEFWI